MTTFNGIKLPNGVTLSVCYRNPTGTPDGLENAVIGSDGNRYSPIFKTLAETVKWLKDTHDVDFIPLQSQNQTGN